jgi:protein-tyrosine-phosphatase
MVPHPLMPAPKLIVTVCTANICRSPMAEALLRHALAAEPEPLRSCKVVSAGVAARGGEKVSPNSVDALAKVGLRISDHRSQPLSPELAAKADLILCMTESHRAVIGLALDPVPENIYLWRELMPKGSSREIADPYGGPIAEYEACRDEMVEAIPSIIEHLRKLAAS